LLLRRFFDDEMMVGPELKQENRGETKHLLLGGCFAWHSKVETKQETSFEFAFRFTWNARERRWECFCFHTWNEITKFATLLPNYPRFHRRTQENIGISAHDSTRPFSILPITRFRSGYIVNSDFFCCFGNSNDFTYQQATPPDRTTYAKCDSATCGRSRRNGTRCLRVSFLETWNAQEKALVCFEKRNAGENRVSFLLFHYRRVSTLALDDGWWMRSRVCSHNVQKASSRSKQVSGFSLDPLDASIATDL